MTENPKSPLSHAEIDAMLQKHELWLKSGHKDGERADFSNAIIQGYNFSGKALMWATFYNAHLYHCSFAKTVLNDVYFTAAEIVRSDFSESKLDGADFSWSCIKGCSFKDCEHLTVKNLKRTNLAGSILPDSISFDGSLDYANDLIKKSRNVFGISMGFAATMLLVLLFGNHTDGADTITFSLPLLSHEIVMSSQIGLVLNLFMVIMLGIFYSLSLSAVKRQLDKMPAVFPDGRFAYETIFPWFWVTWIGEMWQTDYTKANKAEKYLLWSRLVVFSSVSNVLFLVIFVVLLLLLNHDGLAVSTISQHRYWTAGLIVSLFAITLFSAYKSRDKSYFFCAVIGAITAWSSIYIATNLDYMLLVAFGMIAAWWGDRLIYSSNQPFDLYMSVPETNFYSDNIKSIFKYVEPRLAILNVFFGLVFCSLAALYIFHRAT